MKISVITVCRNVLPDLERTYKSVAEQSYNDFEFIVIDGASTDGTVDFLQNHLQSNGGRIDRYISESDSGIYDAMNKGVRHSTGEWIIFMNAGDTFAEPDTLKRVAADMERLSCSAVVVYGDVIKNIGGEDVIKKSEEPHRSHRMIFCHQSAFALREELKRVPFDTAHPYSADYKFFMTLLKDGKRFGRLDYPVSRFDTGGVSNRRRSSGLIDNMKVIREVYGLWGGMPEMLHLLPTVLISKLRGK